MEFTYHRVEKGETLESISKKYGVSKHVLARINNGLKNSQLSEGKYIIICKGDVAGEEQKDGKDKAAAAEGKRKIRKTGSWSAGS